MPIDSKDSNYSNNIEDWVLLEDSYLGDSAIKKAGTIYLPKLKGQDNTEYEAYKNRGVFSNVFARVIGGYSGAILRKQAVLILPKILEPFLKQITLAKNSVEQIIAILSIELLKKGYLGILVDYAQNPYFSVYIAESITKVKVDENGNLILLCLYEKYNKENLEDKYEEVEVERIRMFEIIENKLLVQLYEKNNQDWNLIETKEPVTLGGKRLDFIPFVFFGAIENSFTASKPPLLDLAKINIKHWQLNVDYYHGLHYCALPTPWAVGFNSTTKLYIGPNKAWISDNPEAKCGFLEFSGQGLGAVKIALDDLLNMMAITGARMLEAQKKGIEAYESIKLRSAEDHATLLSIVNNIENGLELCFQYMGFWLGKNFSEKEIKVDINKDFISTRLNSSDIEVLLKALIANTISQDTFLSNLQSGEILPKGRTIEQEKDLIGIENKGDDFHGNE